MNRLMTFEQYSSDLKEFGGYFNVALEPTRLLVGSLVRELQHYHLTSNCPIEITRTTVWVKDGIAHLRSPSQPYTTDRAIQSYGALRKFLVDELFDGKPELLPYSFRHFLRLLESNPVKKKDFIRRHYTIQSTSFQLTFLDNLYNFTESMEKADKKKVKSAINRATTEDNWYGVMAEHHLFSYISKECGSTRPEKVLRYSSNHLDRYNNDYPGARYSLVELARQIHHNFSDLIVDIQNELYNNGFLRRFGIDPTDDC